jgi:hypothetical protein
VNKLNMASISFNIFQFVFSVWVWFSCRISWWKNRLQVADHSIWLGNNPMDKAPGLLFFATSQGG